MNQAACSQFLFCCWSAVKPWASYFPSLRLSVTSQSCCEGGERMLEEHTASPGPGRAFREHSILPSCSARSPTSCPSAQRCVSCCSLLVPSVLDRFPVLRVFCSGVLFPLVCPMVRGAGAV